MFYQFAFHTFLSLRSHLFCKTWQKLLLSYDRMVSRDQRGECNSFITGGVLWVLSTKKAYFSAECEQRLAPIKIAIVPLVPSLHRRFLVWFIHHLHINGPVLPMHYQCVRAAVRQSLQSFIWRLLTQDLS